MSDKFKVELLHSDSAIVLKTLNASNESGTLKFSNKEQIFAVVKRLLEFLNSDVCVIPLSADNEPG